MGVLPRALILGALAAVKFSAHAQHSRDVIPTGIMRRESALEGGLLQVSANGMLSRERPMLENDEEDAPPDVEDPDSSFQSSGDLAADHDDSDGRMLISQARSVVEDPVREASGSKHPRIVVEAGGGDWNIVEDDGPKQPRISATQGAPDLQGEEGALSDADGRMLTSSNVAALDDPWKAQDLTGAGAPSSPVPSMLQNLDFASEGGMLHPATVNVDPIIDEGCEGLPSCASATNINLAMDQEQPLLGDPPHPPVNKKTAAAPAIPTPPLEHEDDTSLPQDDALEDEQAAYNAVGGEFDADLNRASRFFVSSGKDWELMKKTHDKAVRRHERLL